MSSLYTCGFARPVACRQVSCRQANGGSGQAHTVCASLPLKIFIFRDTESAFLLSFFSCQEHNSVKSIEHLYELAIFIETQLANHLKPWDTELSYPPISHEHVNTASNSGSISRPEKCLFQITLIVYSSKAVSRAFSRTPRDVRC